MGSPQIRDGNRVSCIGRRILYHWATREVPTKVLAMALAEKSYWLTVIGVEQTWLHTGSVSFTLPFSSYCFHYKRIMKDAASSIHNGLSQGTLPPLPKIPLFRWQEALWLSSPVNGCKKEEISISPPKSDWNQEIFVTTSGLLGVFLVAQVVKNLSAMQETLIHSLGPEDALDKGMATDSSILALWILWTEEPGRL